MINRSKRRKFGQNYLKDKLVLAKMNDCISPKKTDHIIEIGPGEGALTEFLLSNKNIRPKAIDIDEQNIDLLKEKFSSYNKADFIQADFLNYDLNKINDLPVRIVGNLPYNVSTQIILSLIYHHQKIYDMHFLVQKEVAEKINGKSQTKNWGKLAIKIACFFESEMLFNVYPESFDIKPRVDSTFIKLKPRPDSIINMNEVDGFFNFIDDALTSKRKNIKNNLKKYDIDWEMTSIDPKSRTEQLSLETLISLFRSVS
jgi:16S rRNA (adenine1518-N6/adenine1519-N6)-dimethyltransferase